jgi:hypothetical protein
VAYLHFSTSKENLMPRRNLLLDQVMKELTATDAPVEEVLKLLGVDYETGRRLVKSKEFQRALARWRGYMAQLREIDLARAAVKGAGNVLRGASAAAKQEALSSNDRIVSTSAIRLAQNGEKSGTNREKTGTNRNSSGTKPEQPGTRSPYVGPKMPIRPVMAGQRLIEYQRAQALGPREDPLGQIGGKIGGKIGGEIRTTKPETPRGMRQVAKACAGIVQLE